MAATGVGFRWLDILEKEFDKACVELDTSLVELESDEPEVVFAARQRIATLSSCFAQLTHKALTVFQHSAKLEAEIVDMRADLIQARAASADSPCTRGTVSEAARARAEAAQLARENAALRETILALHSELFGARLATKYLDKELAGRIQQLQLLGRDMRTDVRDSLWAQVEAEILLQRHKTLVRVCRGVGGRAVPPPAPPGPPAPPRSVTVRREPRQGLGIAVTGGREHGVPILISELEQGGPAARTGCLYVGDAILAVNGIDLSQACHKEAVQALQSTKGDCELCVQFIATDDDDRLSEDNYRFPLYPMEDGLFCERDGAGATPTAPRTPECHRPPSEASYSEEECGAAACGVSAGVTAARSHGAILDMDDHSIKIQADLESADVESPPCSRRRRGPYVAIASSSGGSTPVHRGGRGGGDYRGRGDYRGKGDYRPLGPGGSPEPRPPREPTTLQDCGPVSPSPQPTPLMPLPPPREAPRLPSHYAPSADIPAIPNIPSAHNTEPKGPHPALSVRDSEPNIPNSNSHISNLDSDVPNSVHSVSNPVPNVTNSLSDIVSSLSNSVLVRNSEPDVPETVNAVNGDAKTNGDGKKRDKFRIGSARRVTPHSDRPSAPLTNGVTPHGKAGSSHGKQGLTHDKHGPSHGKQGPPLLAGDGDPDFGTPV